MDGPVETMVVVGDEGAIVRQGMLKQTQVVCEIPAGAVVEVLQTEGNRAQIRWGTGSLQRTGWVSVCSQRGKPILARSGDAAAADAAQRAEERVRDNWDHVASAHVLLRGESTRILRAESSRVLRGESNEWPGDEPSTVLTGPMDRAPAG